MATSRHPITYFTRDRAALQIQKLFRGNRGRYKAAAERRRYEVAVKYVPRVVWIDVCYFLDRCLHESRAVGFAITNRTIVKLQKRYRGKDICSWKVVALQRRIKEFLINKDRDLQIAKKRTKQNYYRHRSQMQKDEAEDLDDYAAIAHDWVHYWDESVTRWMWWSGASWTLAKLHCRTEGFPAPSVGVVVICLFSHTCPACSAPAQKGARDSEFRVSIVLGRQEREDLLAAGREMVSRQN